MRKFLRENWFKIIIAICAVSVSWAYITKIPNDTMTLKLENGARNSLPSGNLKVNLN